MLLIGAALVALLCGLLILFLWEDRQRKTAQTPAGLLAGFWKKNAERRSADRLRWSLRVRYDVITPNGQGNAQTDREATSENVSEGGICLQLYERLVPPTRLKFEILLRHGAEPIRGVGEVRWTQEERRMGARRAFLTGIQFTEFSPTEHDRLVQLLKRRPAAGTRRR